jgi:hypothetical protein
MRADLNQLITSSVSRDGIFWDRLLIHILQWAFPAPICYLWIFALDRFVFSGNHLDLMPPIIAEVEPIAKHFILIRGSFSENREKYRQV